MCIQVIQSMKGKLSWCCQSVIEKTFLDSVFTDIAFMRIVRAAPQRAVTGDLCVSRAV